MISLNLRVLIAASAILSSFFGLAGVTLDRSYRANAEQAMEEQLQGYIYALIAAASLTEKGQMEMPVAVPDTRFSNPDSGLYARVVSNNSEWFWQSESMAGVDIPFKQNLARTERSPKKVIEVSGRQLYLFSYGVEWSDAHDPLQAYTFSVAQDMSGFNGKIADFRRSLWGTLGGVALLLLAVQGSILRWGLSPLKHASSELKAIEAGQQKRLQDNYPPELQGLTGNINTLLSQQQEHLERYRLTLGDLAHSLKTPLAILQTAVESETLNKTSDQTLSHLVREQVERMNQITGYQLQRAATSGWTALAAPVVVREVARKVIAGLNKVYADKNIEAICTIDESVEFHGDEGDLMELIGNLVDNAYKWSNGRVRVKAKNKPGPIDGQQEFILSVEDDGEGIAPDMVRYVMQRGQRADTDIAGHGIGLSIVRNIAQVYGGTLEIVSSVMGGASVTVWLPMHGAIDAEKPHF
ncbi:MAG: GHKL domain-containing protein [Ectothiorhodospiraceae bacterium]|nr:GHKL domain-containing protein [Ectothiorhodospiraceae bacterium]